MKKSVSTSKWDAVLDTDMCDPYNNAELTLKLRIGFRQINPAGGAAEGTYNDYGDATETARKIIKWTPQAWNQWTSDLVSSAQKYWHGKFWLVNNFAELEYEVKSVKYRPNVWCRCEISAVLIDPAVYGPWDVHHTIDAVRLHPSVKWFGSHATLYDSRDTRFIEKARDSRNRPILQQAHVHEIGHLLGMGHVDEGKAHCPVAGDTNAAMCYGVSDPDKRNVMGSGMALTADLAKPWRRAIVQITGKGNADTVSDWAAKMMRHYPRTAAEAAAGAAITSRKQR